MLDLLIHSGYADSMAQLTIGKHVVFFDDVDIPLVMKHTWRISERNTTSYAFTTIAGNTIFMHKLILPNNHPLFVTDHIDHNGLNNRRSNLRLISQQQNCIRKRSTKSNTGVKGVSYIASRKKYQATIQIGNSSMNLGRFKSLEEAKKAYELASDILFPDDGLKPVNTTDPCLGTANVKKGTR